MGAPAAEACDAYIFPNGKNGYLPALGERQIGYNNKTAIYSALVTIGGTQPTNDYYWSSTQSDETGAWPMYCSDGHCAENTKALSVKVRAFTTLF